MAIDAKREYRSVLNFKVQENAPYTVRGYAATFEPYVLYSEGGVDYSERIDPHAFDQADMQDVILQYNHAGKVFARQSNGTLELGVDAHGLWIKADLSSTEASKALYDEIRMGLITKMSFAFTVAEDHYERDTHTRGIDRVKKVYDVSAVSIPANPGTDISARAYFDGVIEAEKAERLEAERRQAQRKRLQLKMRLNGGFNNGN